MYLTILILEKIEQEKKRTGTRNGIGREKTVHRNMKRKRYNRDLNLKKKNKKQRHNKRNKKPLLKCESI